MPSGYGFRRSTTSDDFTVMVKVFEANPSKSLKSSTNYFRNPLTDQFSHHLIGLPPSFISKYISNHIHHQTLHPTWRAEGIITPMK